MVLDTIGPTAPQHRRAGQPPAMRFEWRRCPRHPWLGVSVLIVGNCTPLCMDGDGTTHVASVDLESAA